MDNEETYSKLSTALVIYSITIVFLIGILSVVIAKSIEDKCNCEQIEQLQNEQHKD